MSISDATPDFEDDFKVEDKNDRAFLGHPKGLGYLAFVEGCERFSYYSMQTLLALYMVNYLLLPGRMEHVVGLEWLRNHHWDGLSGQPLSSAIFGDYTSLVFLTPILGGIIADRFIGRRAALIAGGIIMAIGHFLMAFEGLFIFALLSLIVGVGLFKGNIASQVGALYKDNDLRRATAFQIFYIAINGSVIVAPLISGTLGEKIGWHWGFGCAGVVMVIGLLLFLKGQKYLPDNAPHKATDAPREKMQPGDWGRVAALFLLVPAMAMSLMTNLQIFNAYMVWADQNFDRPLPSWLVGRHLDLFFFKVNFTNPFPTSWMVSVDSIVSLLMLLVVALFWVWWGKRFKEPDELGKMIIGSFFVIAGGLCLYIAALTQGLGKISLFWPVMFHLLNSIGFANILPPSLALFAKIAPKAINSTVIGIYYLAFFLGSKAVGHVGEWFSSMPTTSFWLIHVVSTVAGLIAFILFKLLVSNRMMAKDVGLAAA